MIKKIISVAFVAAVLSVGVYSYTQSQHEKSMNSLSLVNVEALADDESTSKYKYVESGTPGSGVACVCYMSGELSCC